MSGKECGRVRPVSAQGHLCTDSHVHPESKELTAVGAGEQSQAPGLWGSFLGVLLVHPLPQYLCFPYRDTNWLKTVTERCSTDMSYVDRDFMGSQIGQDSREYRKFYASSWFFRDIWLLFYAQGP